jgi:hypothetical protein
MGVFLPRQSSTDVAVHDPKSDMAGHWNIGRHSGLMFAARITLPHFSVSLDAR